MESKKINQLATELAPDLSDLTIIGDPTTGISKKITLSQMASLFTGTVEEYANLAAFPLVGVADTIYIALDTNVIYRYDTSLSAYVILSPNIINSLVFSDANGFDGTITLVGSVATLSITTALTLGSVPFIGASGALTQDNSNLFFDDTNNRLGIATASPTTPLDVFGSGIIGRLNATSTNNSYLGFASNGTNKWSAGNVQSDHRFRIFSEANSAELITILQTGEFGIGIANPLTKFHIDGGATALIANLDANVSVAKSVSFRSDNSSRINLEVSGTESGSNAGADFFLRTFTDAGALLNTPLTITRATGAAAFISTISATGATFTDNVLINNSASLSKLSIKGSGSTTGLELYVLAANATLSNQDNGSLAFQTNGTNRLTIASTGASTFSTNVNIDGEILTIGGATNNAVINNIASVRINIDSNNTDTAESFTIGNNQTIIDNNNVLFRVQENGNVGIGNSAPQGKLHIGSALSNSGDAAAIILKQTSTTATTGIYLERSGERKGYYMYIGSALDGLTFQRNNDGTKSDVMCLARDGNVGIGTISPTHNLEIANPSGSTYIKLNADFGIGYIGMETADDSMRFVTANSNPIQFYTANILRMTIAGGGAVSIVGSLSKGSGSFRIDHPLESMTETHQLVHSFVEAPQADLYYRGKIKLVNGKAQENIDEVATMTEGTFEALCREVQCFTTNESGWDLIKGKVIGNIIYIESQNANSTDEISWLVIGERKDKHIMETEWTDENGKVIVEPLKPIIEEQTIIEQAIIEEENPIIKEEEVIIEEKEVILEPKTI